MRYTLYDINVDFILIDKEVEFIENYFEMEKMRYPKDYNITLTIKNDSNNLKISPLLFFTFIENAFKYGLKSENPFLKIYIEIKEKKVYFAVENDTVMNQKKSNSIYGGIGIENAKKRLNLLYPQKHQIKIYHDEQKFSVKLNLDLSNE
jgi:LytS/YehU family sensor histidine kinase